MAVALATLALLAVAALVHPLRPIVMLMLTGGFVVARARGDATAGVVAAALPVSVALAWAAGPAPAALPGDCIDPLAPVALGRLFEMVAVVVVTGALVGLRAIAGEPLPVRRPSVPLVAGLALAASVVAAGSLLLGPAAAGPFFGDFVIDLAPAALVPALVFAVSNAIAEEVAYRGVLRAGLVPILGSRAANVGQAAIFALAHAGPDFVGSPLPVMAAMFAGAFIAGEIVARYRSLLVPIALHAAFDLPIFFYWACRVG